jgi:hypothetical protein
MIKSKMIGWSCSKHAEKGSAYRILVGKPKGKGPLGRQSQRSVDNIKMNLRMRGWIGMGWIDLAQEGTCRELMRTRKGTFVLSG